MRGAAALAPVKSPKSAAVFRLDGYRVVHDIPGRLRLRPNGMRFPAAGALHSRLCGLKSLDGAEVAVSAVTGSILIRYAESGRRNEILRGLGLPDKILRLPHRLERSIHASPSAGGSLAMAAGAADDAPVRNPLPGRFMNAVYPRIVAYGLAVLRAVPYILTGLKNLLRGRLNMEVLDGAALTVCLLRRDFRAAGAITFFFALGEYLADWTRRKSRASLTESLSLNIDGVWLREGELERKVPLREVKPGDVVVVRAGSAIPVDGTVLEGDGMVNQASMTGESLPVHRKGGGSVYAGSVLEEGELAITASRVGGETRINAILRSIEESENVKASIQGSYERIADAIVPDNFLLSGMVYAATRDPMRAGSVLLVDYSCAIRLGTPLSIFTGMREAAEQGVLIKGGKFMEALARADVLVFDKTGTLTEARPALAKVLPFDGHGREKLLRLAACLEEHFAHPVGQAVVRAAEREGLGHREEHAQVEYTVAHGIASRWRGERVLIGSRHFVLEDEHIPITPEQHEAVRAETSLGRSALFLAIGGRLAGVLLIEDKIRDNTRTVIEALRADGLRRVIMLTGDNEHTAESIAAQAGITEVKSRLLPADKAAFVASLKKRGHTVMMVGDGINDSPALSAADVGIAMAGGADMAREVADVVLVNGNLEGLLLARSISRLALERVKRNFRISLLLNSLVLTGGLLGLLRPGLSAFLHNAGTAAIAVSSVRPLAPLEGPGETAVE